MLSLAEWMEAAPPYAGSKIARELCEVVNHLAEAGLKPARNKGKAAQLREKTGCRPV
jgi:hypothetical protein